MDCHAAPPFLRVQVPPIDLEVRWRQHRSVRIHDLRRRRSLFEWLLGLRRPPYGRVEIDGLDLMTLSPRDLDEWRLHTAGGVWMDPFEPFDNCRPPTLEQVLGPALLLAGVRWRSLRSEVRRTLADFRIDPVRWTALDPVELRWARVAAVLVRDPSLVVLGGLEEGLDPRRRAELRLRLRRLASFRCTVLTLEGSSKALGEGSAEG